jgi:D-beta-D-heptose 7-phosphate kinase/D-beta-D-heptose 1-phosphate adenosyltransferase
MYNKIATWEEALELRQRARAEGRRVVFTNGVFDILHRGHVEYLQKARTMGDLLMVGLNSDSSVKRIKGPTRPINTQEDRAVVLSALACVDRVVVFDEDTPFKLIELLVPDVLVKGADWKAGDIVGADVVLRNGGRVETVDLVHGKSTTGLIRKITEVKDKGQ